MTTIIMLPAVAPRAGVPGTRTSTEPAADFAAVLAGATGADAVAASPEGELASVVDLDARRHGATHGPVVEGLGAAAGVMAAEAEPGSTAGPGTEVAVTLDEALPEPSPAVDGRALEPDGRAVEPDGRAVEPGGTVPDAGLVTLGTPTAAGAGAEAVASSTALPAAVLVAETDDDGNGAPRVAGSDAGGRERSGPTTQPGPTAQPGVEEVPNVRTAIGTGAPGEAGGTRAPAGAAPATAPESGTAAGPSVQATPAATPAAAPAAVPQATSPVAGAPTPAAAPEPPPLAPQLAEQLGARMPALRAAGEGQHVLTLRVDPEHLGPVRVVAHISHEGVRIELLGATEAARQALRAALPDLRRDLVGAGLTGDLDLGAGNGSDTPEGDRAPSSGRGHSGKPTEHAAVPTAPHATVPPAHVRHGLDLLA